MGLKTGFPPPYLVTLTPERVELARQYEIARNAIDKIEECRAELIEAGYVETAHILDIALLQLSMSVHDVGHEEFVALTDAVHSGASKLSKSRGDSA